MIEIIKSLDKLCKTNNSVIFDIFNAIGNAYSETHRKYHTISHIDHMLQMFKEISSYRISNDIQNEDLFIIAIAEHDIVYIPEFSHNEEASAKIAHSHCKKLGIDSSSIEYIMNLIIATDYIKFKSSECRSTDQKIIRDLDFSIFGSSPFLFDLYNKSIKEEYLNFGVSPETYKKERDNFFVKCLKKERLFLTDFFYSKYEKSARENIKSFLKK